MKASYQNEHEALLSINIKIIITINKQDEQMESNHVINVDVKNQISQVVAQNHLFLNYYFLQHLLFVQLKYPCLMPHP